MYKWDNMKEYLKFKNWYSITSKKLKKKYGPDYKLMAGLIASSSPRFSIKRNIRTAENIYGDFKYNPGLFIEKWKNEKKRVLKEYKILNAHYNNILTCIEHDFKKPLELSGMKVNSFYNNLIGNKKYITIDVWMLKYFNHSKAWINKSEYILYSNILKIEAYIMGLNPCEYQAVIWTKIRAEYGLKPKNFYSFI